MSSIRAPRLTRPLLITLAVVLAVSGLLFTGSLAGSAHAATARTGRTGAAAGTGSAKPTIVLVHGAWADSGSWNAVTAILQHDGYTVYAPPDPLLGLPTDTTALTDFLQPITGPIVLVGHSYGGEVITNAADGNSQVKALVYDDSYLPAKGEDLTDLTTAGSCFYLPAAQLPAVFNLVPYPGSPSGDVAYVKQNVFPGCFANGLPASQGAVLAATQRPLATSAFTDPSGTPAWATIPSWDIIGLNDHVVTPAEQLFMAHRAHAHITEINAPHLSMITDPGAVASVIIQAAQTTSRGWTPASAQVPAAPPEPREPARHHWPPRWHRTLIFGRLFTGAPLPNGLKPTLSVLVSRGRHSRLFFSEYRKLPFTPNFWAFTFPVAASANLIIGWLTAEGFPLWRAWSWTLAGIVTALVITVTAATAADRARKPGRGPPPLPTPPPETT